MEDKKYQVIDKRRFRDEEFGQLAQSLIKPSAIEETPAETKSLQEVLLEKDRLLADMLKQQGMSLDDPRRQMDMAKVVHELEASSVAEVKTERADAPDQPTGPANRFQRRATEKASRLATRRAQKKTFKVKEKCRPADADTTPLDPITFMGVISGNMNEAVCANERARERIPSGDRLMADELQMSCELAFVLARIDAYGPKNAEDRLRIIAIAQDMKPKFKFKHQDGSIVTAKDSPLIIQGPPLIVAG